MALDSIMASMNGGRANKVVDNITSRSDIFGRVGSVIKGTVSGIGEEASVTFGDRKVSVSKELVQDYNVGDEMEFLVEDTDGKSVALKALQDCAGISTQDSVLKSLSNTKVVRDTNQFVNLLSESDLSIDIADEVEDNAKKVSRLSADDLRMLRQLGIDVTNSDLSHLMGLVNQYHAQQEGRTFVTASAEVAQAIQKAQNMSRIKDGSLKYMMDNNMEFTYANVYKAEYSAIDYPVTELANEEWQALKPQMQELMNNIQVSVTDANLDAAKWMLAHECDVTAQNFELYATVQKFNEEGLDTAQYEKNVNQQLQVDETWQIAPLAGTSLVDKAQALVEGLANTTNQEVDTLVAQEQPITIGNLIAAGQERMRQLQGMSGDILVNAEMNVVQQTVETTEGNDAQYIKLQEIRLRLTVQSGYQIMRMGIDIEALEMNDLIDELNHLQSDETKALLQEERIAVTEHNISLYQQTMTLAGAIPSLPSYTLGTVMAYEASATITTVVQQGSMIAGSLYRSGAKGYETISGQLASYEQVMTMPRADMGDSIHKAFANMDSMMMEMNMELTDENRKAVRILAYNQMEINQDNVDAIKILDNRLMSVVQNMTPEVVLGMIRDGVNPINMNLEELEHEIAVQKEKNGDTEEKRFSEFLYSLDKKGEITSEERQSYIGIYKLLDRITSYSDRDLGALVKGGQDITLDNLLTSYYSRKKVGTETAIDDEFGMLEQLNQKDGNVRTQIESGYAYVKDVLNHKTEAEEWDVQQQLETEMSALGDVSKEAIQLVKALEQPYHPSNLLAAQNLLENTQGFYQNIAMELEKRGVESKEIHSINEELEQSLLSYLEEMDTQAEPLQDDISKETVSSPVEDYMNRMDDLLMQAESTSLTAKDLSAMKQIHTMLTMTRQLCNQQQYMVPVALEQEVLTMHVSVVQKGSEPKMELQVEAPSYGMVYVEVSLQEQGAALTLSGSNTATVQMLARTENAFVQSLAEQGLEVAQITIVNEANGNGSQLTLSDWTAAPQENKMEQGAATAFYQIAKSMIQIVRNLG